MGIALMPYVEDDLVGRGVKRLVQSDGQFHHSKIGGHVSAVLHDGGHDAFPNLLAQGLGFLFVQCPQIRGTMDLIQ